MTQVDFTAPTAELIAQAAAVCQREHGNLVFLRGLIEFSNHCKQNCFFCGLRRDHHELYRYRLSDNEILATIQNGMRLGFKTFVLQSGEDPSFGANQLIDLVTLIRKNADSSVALTLSAGELNKQDFKRLKEAGVDRYLLRFETSDPKLYALLKPGHTLASRLNALHHLKELGYEVGSGYMTGLPGETETTRINNALLAQQLKLDMVGVGPFIPNPFTPLSAHPQKSIEQAIRAVAFLRLLLPKANIPATTAAGSLQPDGRERMLQAGANVVMPNLTPPHSKKHYQLYPGKICLDEEITTCLECLVRRIESAGKQISWDRGNAQK